MCIRDRVPVDYLKRARAFERANGTKKPVQIEVKSRLSIRQAMTAMGRTWLDEELALRSDVKPRDGFGAEVKAAKEKRLAFLREQKFLKTSERLTQNVLKQLEARDLKAAGAKLSKEIGKPYFITAEKGQLTGVFRKVVNRPSGKYAVIETSGEFTLVPWRKTMDRNVGRSMRGEIGGATISWSLSKGRGLS